MENKEYNGWTNYETWNWNLWYGDSFTAEDFDGMDGDTYKISKYLENWTEDYAEEIGIWKDNGFFSDVVRASISEVNFYEIAEHFVEDFDLKPDDEDDEEE